jgi:riboflavin kinase/FMN adenylyltransferase
VSDVLRWTDLSQIPPGFGPCVLTLGNFDGVHRGPRAVLTTVVGLARERSAHAVAITFDPHPLAGLHPERAPEPSSDLAHRLELLESTGLDGVLVQPFSREFAQLSPEEFVKQYFVEPFGACVVVVGKDTRFGVHNSGDVDTLRELGAQLGFEVVVLGDVGDGHRWSSTQVRSSIAAGDVEHAADVLGGLHRVAGVVVHGAHRGRELGFPTANLAGDSAGLVPADGVYAGWLVRLDRPADEPERRLPAAISVGTNPTFDDVERTVEAYVLDRTDLDLYDERVAIEFAARLRSNDRFESIESLLLQMADDVERTRTVLGLPRSGPSDSRATP